MNNLIGQKFGKLLVIKKIDRDKWSHVLYLCLCDCGKEKKIRDQDLLSGNTKSCGCIKGNLKHGHTKKGKHSKTYITWYGMLSRCNNPKNKKYKYYGGRGITVCKRWLQFENFLEDMGERPEEKSIDRINNDLGYFKENCRWATQKEQSNNKTNNKKK